MSMRFCLQGVFRFLPNFLSLYTLRGSVAAKSRNDSGTSWHVNDTFLAQCRSRDVHGYVDVPIIWSHSLASFRAEAPTLLTWCWDSQGRTMRSVTRGWNPGSIHYALQHVDIQVKCHGCGAAGRLLDRNSLANVPRHAYIEEIQPRLKCRVERRAGNAVRVLHQRGRDDREHDR